jgi:hypothetical protein
MFDFCRNAKLMQTDCERVRRCALRSNLFWLSNIYGAIVSAAFQKISGLTFLKYRISYMIYEKFDFG